MADEPEHAGEHLMLLSAVVAVEQDDLVSPVAVDLARMAKSDEVLPFVHRRSSLRTRVWHTMKARSPPGAGLVSTVEVGM